MLGSLKTKSLANKKFKQDEILSSDEEAEENKSGLAVSVASFHNLHLQTIHSSIITEGETKQNII